MTLVEKLRLKAGEPLWLLAAPEDIRDLFKGISLKTRIAAKDLVGQLLFFAENKQNLERALPAIFRSMKPDGLMWIAYPKKSGSIQSDLIRDEGWEMLHNSEWQGVASISINQDWTGMRFRHQSARSRLKTSPPIEERQIEGIDFINRTVKLPDDAVRSMKPFKGLESFFYTLAFTHKKEYVEAIAEAKKPETRQRRIEGMIRMVLALKDKKKEQQSAKKKSQQST